MNSPFHRVLLAGLVCLAFGLPGWAQSTGTNYTFSHLAGPPGGYGNADGAGATARFFNPTGIAADAAGNLYVSDWYFARLRKVTPAGVVTSVTARPQPGAADFFSMFTGVAVDRTGNLYVTEAYNDLILKVTPDGTITKFAGRTDYTGYWNTDGPGATATFWSPSGLTIDGTGNLYVADQLNNLIRKITPAAEVSTFAGAPPTYNEPRGAGVTKRLAHPGSADGRGPEAQFKLPLGVAADSAGNVYVADEYNHTIRKVTPAGDVTTLAGSAGQEGSADGTGADARFRNPRDLAVDAAGNVYVADTRNATVRKITPAGVVSTFAGQAGLRGSSDGMGNEARFMSPAAMEVDVAGTIYVGDGRSPDDVGDQAGTIRKITPAGVVTTLAGRAGGRGSADGAAAAARFYRPQAVALDGAGNVYVADELNHLIRKITPTGIVSTLAGSAGLSGTTDAAGPAARFNHPTGVAVDANGNIYVADNNNHTIRKITPAGDVTTLAGSPGQSGTVNATGAAARFHNPLGVAVDRAGNLYVSDGDYIAGGDPAHQYGVIRKVTPAGAVTTLAGNPAVPPYEQGTPGGRDGVGANALFNHPTGIVVDAAGVVYVADPPTGNIRRITPDGVATTLAGFINEAGLTISFRSPTGLALDESGNLYVTDATLHTVYRVTPDRLVTTIGGTANIIGSADGAGAAAQFNTPSGIAVGNGGKLYVADVGNNAIRLGLVGTGPVITTQPQSQSVVAGGGVQFAVVATASPAPAYQWLFNGSAIAGATGATYSVAAARVQDAGEYTITVTNAAGSVTSDKAMLTVTGPSSGNPPNGGGSGGGGGGGAPSLWFLGALAALGFARRLWK